MRGRTILIAVLVLSDFTGGVDAQSRNDHWFIWRDVGISFTTGVPTNVPGLPNWSASGGSLAQPDGELMIYGDGNDVWNGNHQSIPGVAAIVTGGDGAQEILMLPWPDDATKVAVFSMKGGLNDPYAGYFQVDLTMNGGVGGTPNAVIDRITQQPMSPGGKLMGVPHANGTDYWVLLHARGTNEYHVYQLTAAGLDSVPVVSSTGMVHPANLHTGCLVASYDGSLLAMTAYATNDTSRIDLSYFNDATGEVSAFCSLPGLQRAQGIEFSPGGSKLYVTDQYNTPWSIQQELWQYDLSSLDCAAIRNSKTLLRRDSTQSGNITALKVLAQGPDGKIYYRHFWKHNYLGVVNDPEQSGVACNYVQDGYLTLNDTLLSITNQCKRYHDSEMPWTMGVREVPGPERAQVWPVPMHNEGWLRLAPGHVFDALLWTDATGRLVRRTTTTPVNGLALEPEGLAPGLYTLQALRQGSVVGIGTLVKD